jgi:hypothetical protein
MSGWVVRGKDDVNPRANEVGGELWKPFELSFRVAVC